jgi:hypothetical protein
VIKIKTVFLSFWRRLKFIITNYDIWLINISSTYQNITRTASKTSESEIIKTGILNREK